MVKSFNYWRKSKAYSPIKSFIKEKIEELVNDVPEGLIIDVGGGDLSEKTSGYLLSKVMKDYHNLLVLDLYEEAVNSFENVNYSACNLNNELECDIPFIKSYSDKISEAELITLINVLQEPLNHEYILNLIKENQKKNSYLFITTPLKIGEKDLSQLFESSFKNYSVKRFSENNIPELLGNDYVIKKEVIQVKAGIPYHIIGRIMDKKTQKNILNEMHQYIELSEENISFRENFERVVKEDEDLVFDNGLIQVLTCKKT